MQIPCSPYKRIIKKFNTLAKQYTKIKVINNSTVEKVERLEHDYNNLENEEIVFNEYQKPYLLSEKVYFNISHSKSAIAIIISDSECGIDIEYTDYNKKLKCLNRILNSKEQEEYNNSDDKVLYFYKQWTIKEAYFKYLGTGIKLKYIQLNIENKNIKTEEITLNNEKYVVSYL